MSGGYRGRGLKQEEVDALTADFRAGGGNFLGMRCVRSSKTCEKFERRCNDRIVWDRLICMARTATDKMAATVVEITDLSALFPDSVLKDRIALDVRIEQGSLRAGTRVRLCTAGLEEEIEVVGIELLSNPLGPDVVRIVCSRPHMLTLPTGKADGWTITES